MHMLLHNKWDDGVEMRQEYNIYVHGVASLWSCNIEIVEAWVFMRYRHDMLVVMLV